MRYLFALVAVALSPAIFAADDSPPVTPNPATNAVVTNLVTSTNLASTTNSTASTATNSPAKPPSFKVTILKDRIAAINLDVRYGVLISGTNRITFVIPDKMGMQTDSSKQKVEIRPESSEGGSITIRILSGDEARLLELKPEDLRDQVVGRYPKGKIALESAIGIENLSGPAFDLEWVAGGRTEMCTRIGFVPLGKELIEINLTSIKEAYPPYLPVLAELTLSSRIGPVDGPLKVRKFLTDF
jgi:hypothetical protein